ncbi:hypothetical protein D9757_000527 [Collybiopsis confluens]|uniref:DNA topoisomerase (ATP-hydrolyzing) n=1 Tax=Collybiopsis confluens TaxID=2823264 RepID=A0A8H5MH10_9AGAR|nr:hypothetical protein D9757_000527 [Collybiopsis confluens]
MCEVVSILEWDREFGAARNMSSGLVVEPVFPRQSPLESKAWRLEVRGGGGGGGWNEKAPDLLQVNIDFKMSKQTKITRRGLHVMALVSTMLLDDLLENPESDELVESELESDPIAKLEEMAVDFLSQLCRSAVPSQQQSGSEENFDSSSTGRAAIHLEMADRTRTDPATGFHGVRFITYPKKMASGSARQLAQLFRVVNLMHEASVEQVPATKRDIYYRNVPLFQTQKTVDTVWIHDFDPLYVTFELVFQLVDDIAATVQLDRADLNVRATSKGTFCGSVLSIHLTSGEIIKGLDLEGSLIPVGEDIETFNIDGDLAWAVFQTLCHLQATSHPSLPGKGLIITGKGYPDMATRHLVKTLAEFLPRNTPILALVDDDPYGLDILSVYKHGSSRLRHENGKLAAGRIEWIGIFASELDGLGIDKDNLIGISLHDERKALSMLRRPPNIMPARWRKELMYMLHSRRKAEIEILSSAKPYVQSPDSGDDSATVPYYHPLLKYLQTKLPQFISTNASP